MSMEQQCTRWPLAMVSLAFLLPGLRAQIQGGGKPAAAPRAGECSIEGRVISAATGDPISGLTVGLGNAGQRAPSKTDADGRFHFEDLEAGAYIVNLWSGSGYFARVAVADVRAVRKATGIELRAYKAAVVSGRVQDARRRPVAGVTVSVLTDGTGGGRNPPGRRGATETNDLGEYRISEIPPGRYRLMVERKPLPIQRKTLKDDEDPALLEPVVADVATFYPKSSSLEGAGFFTVGVGQVLEGMDISIASERTVCVQSRILDPQGKNAASINVRVEPEWYSGGGVAAAQGVVGGGAGFEVCGLPRGSYRLVGGLANREAAGRYALARFSITTRGIRVPDMYLRPLVPLRGRLMIDGDGDKRPLGGSVLVALQSPGGAVVGLDERRFAQVTQEGAFVIPAVMPDEYWLFVRAPAGFYVKSATMASVDVLRERLHAAGDELNVVLGQDGATLSVQVADADNHPVPWAAVILGRDPWAPRFASDDLMLRPTDANGRAVFDGIAPGDYRLLAYGDLWDGSTAASPEFFLAHESEGDRVKLAARESRTVQFKVLQSQPRN